MMEVSSLHWLRITRFTGLAFAVREPSFEVISCPRFDMAPMIMRSLTLENIEMATRIQRETHYIEHTEEVIQFIFRETSVGQNISELVLGVNIFDLDFGFQIDSVKLPIRATLWVLDTCLIVGLRPLIIILITASLS